jgi:membrane protein DedA with SNARE-associated domain
MAALLATLAEHGSWIPYLLAVVEEPLVTLGAKALMQIGALDIRLAWGPAVLADLVGDTILYLVGRHRPDCLPLCHRPNAARSLEHEVFRAYGGRILVLAKLTQVAGLPTLIVAGFAHMPLASILFWNLAGTLPKVTAVLLFGCLFWRSVSLGPTEMAVTVLLLAAAAGSGLLIQQRRRSECVP